jgi:maleylpyruvate isomerase
MSSALTLFTYFRSSASYRVRIALNLKALEAHFEYISLPKGEHNADFKKINPQGLLPTLRHGDFVLSQSLAILDYLEERFPEPALYPKDLNAKHIVKSMAQIIACDIHPIDNLRVLKYLKTEMGQSEQAVKSWYQHWILEGFSALEELALEHGGKFCFGDTVTIADICLIPQIFNANRFETDLSKFPKLLEVQENCLQMNAFQAASPGAQEDAF